MTKKNYFTSSLPKNYSTMQKYQWNAASELIKPILQSYLSQTQNNITESKNQLGWKRPWSSSSPTSDLSPSSLLNHGTICHIQSLSISAYRWQIKFFKDRGVFAQWGITDFSQSQVRFKNGKAFHLLPFPSSKYKTKVNLSIHLSKWKCCLHACIESWHQLTINSMTVQLWVSKNSYLPWQHNPHIESGKRISRNSHNIVINLI